MSISRRDLSFLLPMLAAAKVSAQQPPAAAAKKTLPGNVYHMKDVAYKGVETKKSRPVMRGVNRNAFDIEMHETVLGPGEITHPPHKHIHEEIVIVLEGTLEVSRDGKLETAETGAVVYNGSNQLHNNRNIGTGNARYYVIELRGLDA